MDEIEKYHTQDEIIHDTMYWSYMLVTKQITWEQLLDSDKDFGLIFNPDSNNIDYAYVIDMLLEHYIYEEEYEKCQDLVDIKKIYE